MICLLWDIAGHHTQLIICGEKTLVKITMADPQPSLSTTLTVARAAGMFKRCVCGCVGGTHVEHTADHDHSLCMQAQPHC